MESSSTRWWKIKKFKNSLYTNKDITSRESKKKRWWELVYKLLYQDSEVLEGRKWLIFILLLYNIINSLLNFVYVILFYSSSIIETNKK